MITLAIALSIAVGQASLTPAGFEQAKEPQIAIRGQKEAFIAFGQGNAIYVTATKDRGKTFSAPVKVGEPGFLSLGMRRGPRITATAKGITVTAIYGAKGRGRDGDIVAFKSKDGVTWSGPIKVNDVEGSAREGLHAMAAAPDGTLACTWLDLREKGTKLYMSTSSDGGATWTPNKLAYQSPSGSICECCHPSIAFNPKGELFVMFRNSVDGYRDMYWLGLSGQSVKKAEKIGRGTWPLNACPMDGGAIAFDMAGTPVTVWRRADEVYFSEPGGEEVSIGKGANPWATRASVGPAIVWQKNGGVALVGLGQLDGMLTANGNDPVIASSADGAFILAAWNEGGIRVRRLRDDIGTR